MRISTKLKAISGVTTAVLIILIPILIRSLYETRSAKEEFILVDKIQSNFFERSAQRDRYFLNHEDSTRIRWEESKQESDRLLRQAKLQFQRKEDLELIEKLTRDVEDTAVIFRRLVANNEVLKRSVGNREVLEELDKRLSSQLLLKATSVRDAVLRLQDKSTEHVQQHFHNLAIVTILLTGILATIILLMVTNLSESIFSPFITAQESSPVAT